MSKTENAVVNMHAQKRRDGVVGLWGRLRHRDRHAYEAWLAERDMIIITAALLRLNERQLNRIGLSHATLSLDVDDLAHRAAREAQLTDDILRIVEDDYETPQHHAIAAE